MFCPAPALAGYGAFMALVALINNIPGVDDGTINIDENPSPGEIVILVLVALIVPATIAVAVAVSRIGSTRGRRLASSISVAVAILGGLAAQGSLGTAWRTSR